ncbi:hypothetical protein Goarm_000951 [Gossypium armourianum]|uniref:Uncharacterized protein n=1 Tax=Gossypium armourianum TaxID=34283 RepID=A0A7J9KBM6_9ROSI|nr:hypothetical protein [Gossypium armourianum]
MQCFELDSRSLKRNAFLMMLSMKEIQFMCHSSSLKLIRVGLPLMRVLIWW